jgi:hypothetical protein
MNWIQTSHCSWDCGEMRIIKRHCAREGGTTFKLFNGERVTTHESLEEAMKAAEPQNV